MTHHPESSREGFVDDKMIKELSDIAKEAKGLEEGWEKEVREYIDSVFIQRKEGMNGLDREIIINKIRNLLNTQRDEWIEKIRNLKWVDIEDGEGIYISYKQIKSLLKGGDGGK